MQWSDQASASLVTRIGAQCDAGMLTPCFEAHVAHAQARTWTLFGCLKMLIKRLTPEAAEVMSAARELAARRAGCVHEE